MELQEIYDGKIKVIEEDAKTGVLKVQFPFVLADEKNLNGRTYPLKIVEREVKRLNEKIAGGEKILCFTGHPKTVHGDLENVSHLIEKLSITKNIGWGIASILTDSGPGKTVKTILKCGGKIGASLRGSGTVSNGIINDDYEMAGVDWVISPSFGTGTKFGKDAIIENQQLIDSASTARLYEEAQDAGFEGTLEDWKKLRDEKNNFDESARLAKETLDEEEHAAGKHLTRRIK